MTRIAIVLLMLLVAGPPPAFAASQRTAATPPNRQPVAPAAAAQAETRRPAAVTGRLRGRVIALNSDTPVRGAEVTAFLGRERAPVFVEGGERMVVTDGDGRFDFGAVPAGEWTITVKKTGFVAWQPGQRRPFERPAPIVVAAGRVTSADVAIPRGSAIAGRVYDEFTEPISNVRVNVYRARMRDGRRTLEPVGMADQTDDTGAFRIHGLAPGDYYLAASLRMAPADSIVDSTYSPTYFPGTGNLAEAQRIRLELGGETQAEFQLLPVRRVRISGSVVGAGGDAARAFLNLVSDGSELGVPLGIGGATLPDGTFTLPDVAPGSYTLYASLRSGDPEESAETRLVVGNDDVSGVTLVTARAATIKGRVVADPAAAAIPRGLRVTARSWRAGGPMTAGDVTAAAFEIPAPTGPFQVEVHNLPDTWTVQSVAVDGVDATDAPIELRPGQAVTARVVLTNRITDLRGVARSTAAARAVNVVVFPEEPALWTQPRRIRAVPVDAQGTFRVTGLPPGDRYLAVAVDYLEDGEGTDPEFLAGIANRAARVALAEGERRTVELSVVER